jgi:hypothetical protein
MNSAEKPTQEKKQTERKDIESLKARRREIREQMENTPLDPLWIFRRENPNAFKYEFDPKTGYDTEKKVSPDQLRKILERERTFLMEPYKNRSVNELSSADKQKIKNIDMAFETLLSRGLGQADSPTQTEFWNKMDDERGRLAELSGELLEEIEELEEEESATQKRPLPTPRKVNDDFYQYQIQSKRRDQRGIRAVLKKLK